MDGRPHIISVIEYQELCRVVERSEARNCPSARGARLRVTAGEEREDGVSAAACRGFQFSGSSFRGGTESVSSFAAANFDAGKRLLLKQRIRDEEKSAFDSGGFELGFRCGEAELARAKSAFTGVDFHVEIRTKQPLDPFGRSQGGGVKVTHQERVPPLSSEYGTGIREQRSVPTSQAVCGANPGKGRYWQNGSKTLEGRDYDVARTNSPDALKTPAAEEDGAELSRKIAQCLGPTGPGLLAVRGVPGVAELRNRLLPLAKKLALMPDQLRRLVLKEHDLNTDVPLKRPDRPVSAFATQLGYGRNSRSQIESCNSPPPSRAAHRLGNKESNSEGRRKDPTKISGDKDMNELGRTLRQLGSCMVQVGLLVARLCDEAFPGAELEDALWESGTAKGRLIHYHSHAESRYMSSKATHRSSKAVRAGSNNNVKRIDIEKPDSRLHVDSEGGNEKSEAWQQWHYDYGLFTVLTSPMFMNWEPSELAENSRDLTMKKVEMSSWTHAGGEHSGLIIMHQGVAQYVNIPPNCLVVQVGEAAQILSGGNLAATAHCVCRPPQADVSRETFVVFLQPAWDRTLSPPAGFDRENVLHSRDEGSIIGNTDLSTRSNLSRNYSRERLLRQQSEDKGHHKHEEISAPVDPEEVFTRPREEEHWTKQQTELLHCVPPLASRWSDGCTFAEFSKLTTRQYYGADGRQSQK